MLKVFLSHSSTDKAGYVRQVVERLSANRITYDELTFEEGLKTIDEIRKGLTASDLFVLFISGAALDSTWVQNELGEAYERLASGDLRQILPIIIDKTVTHEDPRIPAWMRREYNLRPVTRPSVASRRIIETLRMLSWHLHPRLREQRRLFVGRNDLIKVFEERVDSFDKPFPVCFIASGLKGVGRRTLLRHCFVKADIINESDDLPTIVMNETDSIEDFILRVYDLGFSDEEDITGMLSRPVSDKLAFAERLVRDIQALREVLLIVDDGGVVTKDITLAKWFDDLVARIEPSEKIAISVAARYRFMRASDQRSGVFILDVPELEPGERGGLLKRYADLEGVELSRADLRDFASVLSGLPEQVYYAVQLIQSLGVERAKKSKNLIVEYNALRVINVVEKYSDQIQIEFLSFLAQFDFISYTFIFEIVGDDPAFASLLDEFFAAAICEYLGATREYLRVNDAVRDYITRNFDLPKSYKRKLNEHLERFLTTYIPEERDASDVLYTLKAAILAHREIDARYLVPSHFLKSMKELYDRRNQHDEVVRLADRVLASAEYLDEGVEQQVRYYLCLSLARKHDSRFTLEVEKIRGPERNFLYGFYFRLAGNFERAIRNLKAALKDRPNFPRARNELARVYVYLEDFDRGLQVAKPAYEHDPTNPYFLKTYFDCLVRTDKTPKKRATLKRLLEEFTRLKSRNAEELFLNAQALYRAFYADDELGALNLVAQAMSAAPRNANAQSLMTKFAICEQYRRIEDMEDILENLERQGISERSYFGSRYSRMKAITIAIAGDVPGAIEYAQMRLTRFYPHEALVELIAKLRFIGTKPSNSA
jgi:hypothetical protein